MQCSLESYIKATESEYNGNITLVYWASVVGFKAALHLNARLYLCSFDHIYECFAICFWTMCSGFIGQKWCSNSSECIKQQRQKKWLQVIVCEGVLQSRFWCCLSVEIWKSCVLVCFSLFSFSVISWRSNQSATVRHVQYIFWTCRNVLWSPAQGRCLNLEGFFRFLVWGKSFPCCCLKYYKIWSLLCKSWLTGCCHMHVRSLNWICHLLIRSGLTTLTLKQKFSARDIKTEIHQPTCNILRSRHRSPWMLNWIRVRVIWWLVQNLWALCHVSWAIRL